MRSLILAAALLTVASAAQAQYNSRSYYGTGSNSSSHYVNPYTRSDGTYVGGHYRTNQNNSYSDNYSTNGNYNPYAGKTGNRSSGYLFED